MRVDPDHAQPWRGDAGLEQSRKRADGGVAIAFEENWKSLRLRHTKDQIYQR